MSLCTRPRGLYTAREHAVRPEMSEGRCNAHELLSYFMETACIEVEPENTRLYRTVLLRIL